MNTHAHVHLSDSWDGVVVGLDGSPGDAEVLRRAAREARAHARTLHVVRSFTVGEGIRAVAPPNGVVPGAEECARAVREEVLDAVAAAGGPGSRWCSGRSPRRCSRTPAARCWWCR